MSVKNRRGGTKCLNCGNSFTEADAYCSVCGQLNDNPKISFGYLVLDFLNNYLSFDSRLGRSIVPFFFQPGYLTLRFMEGKRVAYAHPLRMYLIVSLVTFFLLNVQINKVTGGMNFNALDFEEAFEDSGQIDKIEQLTDEEKKELNSVINFGANNGVATIATEDEDSIVGLTYEDWTLYQSLKKSGYKTEKILDSLRIEEKGFFQKLITKQFIRLDRSDTKSVTGYIVKNASLMMFLLMPIFALILKLAYFRKKEIFYIEHLIHSFHIHTFIFVMFSIYTLLSLFWELNAPGILMLVCMIYGYFSLRKVYGQHHKRTFVKFILIGFLYSTIFLIFLTIEILLSLLIF